MNISCAWYGGTICKMNYNTRVLIIVCEDEDDDKDNNDDKQNE